MAKWMQAFSEDKRIPKDVREICADMYLRVKPNPRVRFCFECGKKLRGNHFIETEVDGHKRSFHKMCIDEDCDEY